MLMSCNALNQSKAKIYNYIGKNATKKYKILVIRDLKRLFVFRTIPEQEDVSPYKISGYFFRFFFLPST